jgi:hypothetical protein
LPSNQGKASIKKIRPQCRRKKKMKMKAKELNYDKPVINEGLYHATLKEVKSIEKGDYGDRVAIVFDVYHSTEEKPVELSMIAYSQVTPKSKMTKALEPLGYTYKEGEEFDTDEFLGNPCKVLIENYTKDGKEVSGVDKVMAPDEQTVEYISKVKELLKGKKDLVSAEDIPNASSGVATGAGTRKD